MTVRDLLDSILRQLQEGSLRLDSLVEVSGVNADDPEIPALAATGDDKTGVLTVYFATPEEVETMLERIEPDDPDEEDDSGFDPEHN